MSSLQESRFVTAGGLHILRTTTSVSYEAGTQDWAERLNGMRGAVLASNYEYPNRYTRWDMAFVNPPLLLESLGRSLRLAALNARGKILLRPITALLRKEQVLGEFQFQENSDSLSVQFPEIDPSQEQLFSEEERSRQPSIFSVLRSLLNFFSCDDPNLGFYGAFGYDSVFQFEPIPQVLTRPAGYRDSVLYFPDEILLLDHYGQKATLIRYEFETPPQDSPIFCTAGLPRTGEEWPFVAFPEEGVLSAGDHAPGDYAEVVRRAKTYFERGDLFEVVPSRVFTEKCLHPPSVIHQNLREVNPSPYSFFFNLGEGEYLVGASPEMYVRVTGGRRVETCPISGTIRRGKNAIEDAAQIRKLLNCSKEEAELTMCSDVDRNDKSRVCVPGSVRVIGRRQIELYARLIHTVDHIEGILRPDRDALDAFLTHSWAVTVTGAPKRAAMTFIEQNEKSPRGWYGGAVGALFCNGDMNTGLTLRTICIRDGIAAVRAGATLLYDSDPLTEEAETELKASALRAVLRGETLTEKEAYGLNAAPQEKPGVGRRVLLVDHEDSFVHILADYFRQTEAEVLTYRAPFPVERLDALKPDLVVLSPGPGRPSDFAMADTIAEICRRNLPLFGVCLGLQGLVEFFGGTLGQLEKPMHGKASEIFFSQESYLFEGLTAPVVMGRYHSLYAETQNFPSVLKVTAQTVEGVIMAIEHETLPIAAVQFHPESIMSLQNHAGNHLIENVMRRLACPSCSKRREEYKNAS